MTRGAQPTCTVQHDEALSGRRGLTGEPQHDLVYLASDDGTVGRVGRLESRMGQCGACRHQQRSETETGDEQGTL